MKCEELLKMLNRIRGWHGGSGRCEEFEKHMAGLQPVPVVVDNIRQTITLYKNGEPYAMPISFRETPASSLREKWPSPFSAS